MHGGWALLNLEPSVKSTKGRAAFRAADRREASNPPNSSDDRFLEDPCPSG